MLVSLFLSLFASSAHAEESAAACHVGPRLTRIVRAYIARTAPSWYGGGEQFSTTMYDYRDDSAIYVEKEGDKLFLVHEAYGTAWGGFTVVDPVGILPGWSGPGWIAAKAEITRTGELVPISYDVWYEDPQQPGKTLPVAGPHDIPFRFRSCYEATSMLSMLAQRVGNY